MSKQPYFKKSLVEQSPKRKPDFKMSARVLAANSLFHHANDDHFGLNQNWHEDGKSLPQTKH